MNLIIDGLIDYAYRVFPGSIMQSVSLCCISLYKETFAIFYIKLRREIDGWFIKWVSLLSLHTGRPLMFGY